MKRYTSILACLILLGPLGFALLSTAIAAQLSPPPQTLITQRIIPLRQLADFTPLLQRCCNKKLILLGDSTHGSKEFYYLRRLLSMLLVESQRIDFIALEADWCACCAMDSYVRALPNAPVTASQALQGFTNCRSWIWKNEEMIELLEQLRSINLQRPPQQRVAIYGIDMLDYANSLSYLTTVATLSASAQELTNCLVNSTTEHQPFPAAQPCGAVLDKLSKQITPGARIFPHLVAQADFTNDQHIEVIRSAMAYYHIQTGNTVWAWNRRINHFTNSIYQLLHRHGPTARGIIWAHNTHVGDARATTMAASEMLSLGQVLRQQVGSKQILLVGQTSYCGTVYACRSWNQPAAIISVPPAVYDSTEAVLHALMTTMRINMGMLLFSTKDRGTELNMPRGQRAIGVIYDPDHDATDNYVTTKLCQRYDAMIFVDTTTALEPLSLQE